MSQNSITIEMLMQHADSLYRFALSRVKDHHVAEDLVQDCLSAAWERIDTFDARSTLSTWLMGIMKFKTIDHFRRSKRTPTDQTSEPVDDHDDRDALDTMFDAQGSWKVDPHHGLDALSNAPDAVANRNELIEKIHLCLEKMPERMRTLFTLREVDGLDVPTVANAAGVTTGSAAVLLTRTRHKLRSCLQEQGIER